MNNDLVARILARRQAMLAPDSASAADTAADDDLIDVQFNRLGGTRVTPIAPVRPWDAPPIPARPTVEIVDWQPRQGHAPLDVTVRVQLAGGQADVLTVLVTGPTEADVQSLVIGTPPASSTHRYRLGPGVYAISAVVAGPGGGDQTQDERLVTVTGEPMTGPQQYPDENTWWNTPVTTDVQADYAEANHPPDDGRFKWFARTAYDIGAGLTKDASWKKHRAEMRAALGLST